GSGPVSSGRHFTACGAPAGYLRHQPLDLAVCQRMTRIVFGTQVAADLAAGAEREWLVPDGLGGYAMGTVSGLRTRRYHALQVVSDPVPAARRVGLVSLDPVLTLPSGARIELGVHEWVSGAIAPHGHELLERFELREGL